MHKDRAPGATVSSGTCLTTKHMLHSFLHAAAVTSMVAYCTLDFKFHEEHVPVSGKALFAYMVCLAHAQQSRQLKMRGTCFTAQLNPLCCDNHHACCLKKVYECTSKAFQVLSSSVW